MQDLLSQFVGRESQQVQAREWPSPHRIHVTEGVCRSNLTEESRIIGGGVIKSAVVTIAWVSLS